MNTVRALTWSVSISSLTRTTVARETVERTGISVGITADMMEVM